MMTTALAIVCWVVFCIFEGRFEAILWHFWSARPLAAFNPHRTNLIIFRRASVLILASLAHPLLAIPHILVFSFIHNGAMYSHRNNINPRAYPLRWQSEPSNDSTAKLNLTYNSRVALFVIGLFCYILCLSTFMISTTHHVQ
jgi:hypothetical protein